MINFLIENKGSGPINYIEMDSEHKLKQKVQIKIIAIFFAKTKLFVVKYSEIL